MATLALAFPVLPGTTGALRALVGEMAGARKAAFEAVDTLNR